MGLGVPRRRGRLQVDHARLGCGGWIDGWLVGRVDAVRVFMYVCVYVCTYVHHLVHVPVVRSLPENVHMYVCM